MSCGKPVAHLWDQYKEKISNGEKAKKAMDEAGLERFCCRAMFMGHMDKIDLISRYKKA
jgi:DNA-directed RNA polymerase subunit N